MIDDVFQELEKIKRIYRSLILTTNYIKRSDSEICWPGYIPGIDKRLYAREYETLVQGQQYSFLLSDDMGFIQFYFRFDNENITKAKMAYYPYPVKLKEEVEDFEDYTTDYNDSIGDYVLEEFYYDIWNLLSSELAIPLKGRELSDELSRVIHELNISIDKIPIDASQIVAYEFERKYEFTNTSHLRIDFDCNVTSHHQCEIQVGALNQIRLPIEKMISPLLFFDFVIKNMQRDKHSEITRGNNFSKDFGFSASKSIAIEEFREKNIFVTHL